MKPRLHFVFRFFIAITMVQSSTAAPGTWNGATSNTWDTTATNWSGVSGTPWDITNGSGNTATFNTASLAAVVSGTVYTNGITFSTTGDLSGGTINLAGTTPIVSVAPSQTGSISSIIDGLVGFTKSGTGSLTLSGPNIYTGTTAISQGTIVLGNAAALGATGAGNTTTIAGGATLDLNGQTIAENFGTSTGSIINNSGTAASITGSIAQGGSNTVIVGGTGNITLATVGANAGNRITKTGTGTLTLAGSFDNNSLGLTINANSGTVILGKASSGAVHAIGGTSSIGSSSTLQLAGSGTGQIFNGATLTVNSGGVFDLNGMSQSFFGGNGNLNLNGTGISSGGALLNNTGTLSTITMGSGNVVLQSATSIGGSGNITIDGTITGASIDLTKIGGGTLALSGTNTYSGTTTISAGTLQLGSGGTTGSLATTSAIVNNNSGTFSVNRSNAVVQGTDFSGAALTGNGGFTQAGSGVTTLIAANDYTGATTINAGILVFRNTSAKSSGSMVTAGASGTVGLGVGAVSGDYTSANVDSLFANNLPGFILNASSGVALDTTAGNFTYATSQSGSRAFGKVGINTLTLTGTNTYTGATTISGGTLQIGAGTDAGSISSSSNITNNGALVFNVGAGNRTYAGAISGTGSLTQVGTGILTLSTANSFSGGLTVKAGTVFVNTPGNVNGLGSGIVTIGDVANTGAAATLQFSGAGSFPAFNNPLSSTGTGTNILGVTGWNPLFNGGLTLSNNLTIVSNNSGGSFFTFKGGVTGTGHITVSINNTSANNLVKFETASVNNVGTLTFNNAAVTMGATAGVAGTGTGTNLITGGVGSNVTGITQASNSNPLTISTTALTVNGTATTLNASGTALFTVSGGVTGTGNLILNTNNATNGILLSTNAVNITGTLTNSGTGTASTTISSAITGGTNVTQNSLTSGLILSGANSYTGATNINTGALTVSGAGTLTGATALTVNSGGRFNYLPTTVGTTLTMGGGSSLTLNNGSTLGLSWDTTTASKIAAPGAVTVGTGAGVALNLTGTFTSGQTYTLLNAGSGLLTGSYTFANLTNYTAAVVKTATAVTVTPTTATALTAAFWKGALTGNTNAWALSDGATSNWVADSGGTATALVPGSGADVTISATSVTTAPTATVLGADMTIKSLTIADTVNGLGLNADGNTLTITPASSTVGISMNASVPTSTIAAKVALGANQTWTNNSASTLNVSGVVSGAFGLTKAGTGILSLSGVNTYTGATAISAGTVQLGNATALGTTAGNTTIASGATLDLNGQTIAEPFGTIAGTGVGSLGALINSSGTAAAVTGTISMGTSAFTVGGSGDITLSQATGTGFGAVITKIGTGTLTLGGTNDNSFLGLTVSANSGTVIFNKATTTAFHDIGGTSSIGSNSTLQLAGTGDYAFYGGATLTVASGGVLDLNGKNQNYDGLNGNLNLNGTGISSSGALVNNTGTLSTLTMGTGSVALQSATSIGGSGNITIHDTTLASAAITGSGLLTKIGTGTLTLSGTNTNTYSGGTAVNAGTLLVNNTSGSGTGTAAVTVASGATLGGSGTITGNITLNAESALNAKDGGKLAPGNSTGVLTTTGTTTLNTGSIFSWELNSDVNHDGVDTTPNPEGSRGTNYDGLTSTNLTVASNAVFRVVLTGSASGDLSSGFWEQNQIWNNLFSVSGTTTNAATGQLFNAFQVYNGTTDITLATASQGSFSFNNSTLTWTAVPEPSSALVGLLITAGLLRRRRG